MFPFYWGGLYFDPTMILLLPPLILSLFAQARVNSTFHKYSQISSGRNVPAAQVARELLHNGGVGHVRVEMTEGRLSDHYDPRSKTLRLSRGVYGSDSIAALGIAAHEAGHAMQHGDNYTPIRVRNTVLPIASIGSWAAFPLLLLGMLFSIPELALAGVAAFGFAFLFQLVTLPVEFNASARAIEVLEGGGYLSRDELMGAKKVLSAASLTYIAAAAMALAQLLRLLLIARGGSRRR